METHKDLAVLLFTGQMEWRAWLEEHHTQLKGVWLKHAKKASGKTSVSYQEAVEVALCYGWIDSQLQTYDQEFYLQKYTPRQPASVWSKVNVAKAEALISAKKMQPSGLAAIEAAKKNGQWDAAYNSPSNAIVPEDFQSALNRNPKAKQFFESLNKANTYAFCWRIATAKKPETRQARIEKFIGMLSRGEKLY